MDNQSVLAEMIRQVAERCAIEHDSSGPVSEEEVAAAERELGVMFPPSYRAFLRQYGAGMVKSYELFGLPRHRLWGDVVMMNQLTPTLLPSCFLKIVGDNGHCSYYLDTSQIDSQGECPVMSFQGGADGRIVAENFLDFLRKAHQGLL
jgi:hypothetical protein